MSGQSARDAILSSLREALRNPVRQLRSPLPPLPPDRLTVATASGSRSALAERFCTQLQAIDGTAEIANRVDRVPDLVVRCLAEWSGGRRVDVLSWTPTELHVPGLEERLTEAGYSLRTPADLHHRENRQHAAALVCGLTGVDAAFAATGTVLLAHGPGKSRAASLLPEHHLLLVPLGRLYPTVEDWLRERRADGTLASVMRDHRQLVFVTGPSKSADIELNLTLGVHGPRVVHAVLFDDGA